MVAKYCNSTYYFVSFSTFDNIAYAFLNLFLNVKIFAMVQIGLIRLFIDLLNNS